jgi:hypothetical protein
MLFPFLPQIDGLENQQDLVVVFDWSQIDERRTLPD